MPELPLYEYGEVFKPSEEMKTGQTVFHAEIVRDGKTLKGKKLTRREKWFEGMWSMFTDSDSHMGKMILALYKNDLLLCKLGSGEENGGSVFGDEYLLDECLDCKLNFMVMMDGIMIESWLKGLTAYQLGVEFRNFLNDPNNH